MLNFIKQHKKAQHSTERPMNWALLLFFFFIVLYNFTCKLRRCLREPGEQLRLYSYVKTLFSSFFIFILSAFVCLSHSRLSLDAFFGSVLDSPRKTSSSRHLTRRREMMFPSHTNLLRQRSREWPNYYHFVRELIKENWRLMVLVMENFNLPFDGENFSERRTFPACPRILLSQKEI